MIVTNSLEVYGDKIFLKVAAVYECMYDSRSKLISLSECVYMYLDLSSGAYLFMASRHI